MRYRNLLIAVCGGALLSVAGATEEQTAVEFLGPPLTPQVARAKERADEYYEDKKYRRALSLYRDTLAETGDKYAQYMVGYMAYLGQGLDADPAMASAWFRLAAERPGSPFQEVLQRVEAGLSDDQSQRAVELHASLYENFGDRAILQRLIDLDKNRLRTRGGSRVGANVGSGRVQVGSTDMDAAEYFRQVEARIRAREMYLDQLEAISTATP